MAEITNVFVPKIGNTQLYNNIFNALNFNLNSSHIAVSILNYEEKGFYILEIKCYEDLEQHLIENTDIEDRFKTIRELLLELKQERGEVAFNFILNCLVGLFGLYNFMNLKLTCWKDLYYLVNVTENGNIIFEESNKKVIYKDLETLLNEETENVKTKNETQIDYNEHTLPF